MFINVYGCDALPKVFYGTLASSVECDDPEPLGWAVVPWFLFVNIIGAYILPTVLIGIVVVSFNDESKRAANVKEMVSKMRAAVKRVQHELPDFFTEWRIQALQDAFNEIDADGELSLDMSEMAPFFAYIFFVLFDASLTEHLEEKLYHLMDADGDGDLGFAEFVLFLAVSKQVSQGQATGKPRVSQG
jgi:hypothetical protein